MLIKKRRKKETKILLELYPELVRYCDENERPANMVLLSQTSFDKILCRQKLLANGYKKLLVVRNDYL